MKKFTVRLLMFIIVFSIVLSSIIVGTRSVMLQASFQLPAEKHVLVVGASCSACGIDDNVYTSAINISQGAEPYLYSYCKIKKFLKENIQIDTVLLAISNSTLNKSMDDALFSEKYMSKISHHLTLLSKDEITVFIKNRKEVFIKGVLQSLINNNYRCIIKYFSDMKLTYKDLDIGKYDRTDANNLKKDILSRQNEPEQRKDMDISTYQLEYLLNIHNVCKENNVILILVNIPVYKPEIYDYPADKLNIYLNTYLKEIKYVDYSNFPLPDSCYRDISHLNANGAKIFSTFLQENLANDTE